MEHSSQRELTIRRPIPHPGQQQFLGSDARFRVVYAGRRSGKTDGGIEALAIGTEKLPGATRRPGLYWWVGLSWKSASMKKAWRSLKRLSRGWCEVREADKEIRLPNGSEIWLRTAENPESLAGEGVSGVVGDEFTLWQNRVWWEYLRPTLSDTRGWALLIGVPKGRNWTWPLWLRGRQGEKGYAAFQIPTADNPYIDREEIDEARRTYPAQIFEQEYLAAIIDDAGLVFRNITECSRATPLDRPEPGRHYVMGVDLAKLADYTAVSIWDVLARREVRLERFTQVNYSVQKPRIIELSNRFGCEEVVVETNSIGEPITEDLEAAGLPVVRFTTTAATKSAVINSLALAFEQQSAEVICDENAILELQAYGMTRLPSGAFRFGAPDGMHDDTVMARAFAWSRIEAVGLPGAGWLRLADNALRQQQKDEEKPDA